MNNRTFITSIFRIGADVPSDFTGLVYLWSNNVSMPNSFLRYANGVGVKTIEPCIVDTSGGVFYYCAGISYTSEEFWKLPQVIKQKLNMIMETV